MPDLRASRRWARKALTLPPRETARLGYQHVRRSVESRRGRQRDRVASTYTLGTTWDLELGRFVRLPPTERLAACRTPLEQLAALHLEHRFDLLGSGWVCVRHGMQAAGLEGHVFPSGPPLRAVTDLADRVNTANRDETLRISSLIGPGYEPIDWHVDFKSGYRWDGATWYRDIPYGDHRGADVKVPWELGRCQHLPRLSLVAGLAHAEGDRAFAGALADEFRNEVLDFVAANPPRYGVHWVTAMDVAIRACNWLLAFDLFRGIGHPFDRAFVEILGRSIWEHGYHIASNLEWSADLRGNHYLADVVGLLFTSAYLPPSATTDTWLRFAIREVIAEIRGQFLGDGADFEGSTSYHRLAAELAVYAVALMLALPNTRIERLASDDVAAPPGITWPGAPLGRLPLMRLGDRTTPVPPDILERLSLARSFMIDIAKHDGRAPQIGDNDNGRLFNLLPTVALVDPSQARSMYLNLAAMPDLHPDRVWIEDHLDHGATIDAIDGLLGRAGAAASGGLCQAITAGLAHPAAEWADVAPPRAEHVRIGGAPSLKAFEARLRALPDGQRRDMRVELGGPDPWSGLRFLGYPAFGLYILKSDRLYLAIRCGPVGQDGNGGHDHNDQLSLELMVDGADWIRDPGTYLYTPLPDVRNAYRSVRAHFAPQLEGPEPASLDHGVFELGPGSAATCIYWGEAGFAGRLRAGDGRMAYCLIRPTADALEVTHAAEGCQLLPAQGDPTDWRAQLPNIPYSAGYGIVERVGQGREPSIVSGSG